MMTAFTDLSCPHTARLTHKHLEPTAPDSASPQPPSARARAGQHRHHGPDSPSNATNHFHQFAYPPSSIASGSSGAMPSRSHTTTTTTATLPAGPAAATMAASRLAQHNSPTPLPASVTSTNGAPARRPDLQTTGSSSSPNRRPSSAPSSKHSATAALANGDGFVANHMPVTVASRSSAAADAASLSDRRPSSAKPKLLRSKSDFVLHSDDGYDSDLDNSDVDHHRRQGNNTKGKKISSWGARHGFGDHYDSEEISHLVNVRLSFVLSDKSRLSLPPWLSLGSCGFISSYFSSLSTSVYLAFAPCSPNTLLKHAAGDAKCRELHPISLFPSPWQNTACETWFCPPGAALAPLGASK